jgi:hypothetical protein
VDSCSVVCPRSRAALATARSAGLDRRPPQRLDFNDLLLGRAPEHVGRGMICETENLVAAAIRDGQPAA